MTWFELIILILACYRLTHLIMFDKITAFLRAPFLKVEYRKTPSGDWTRHVIVKGSGWRRKAGELLSCSWCAGLWCSAAVVTLHMLIPQAYIVLVVLAVAAAAGIMEKLSSR